MIWKVKNSEIDLTSRALVMGILNVTLDSFSDGGKYVNTEAAVTHCREMAAQGASILDIGGESSRPGAEPVEADVELARVLPVIQALHAAELPCWISIDTMKPQVARKAVEAGAHIVNDITGLRDPAMIDVVRSTGAGAVVMHMQGTPRTMQANPEYEDVVASVSGFFRERLHTLTSAGVPEAALAFDPGIGFGKTLEHNLALLRNLKELGGAVPGRPMLLGVSRKSFIGRVLGSDGMEDREWPTVALSSFAREQGARIVRVHAVKANVEAIRMTEAILGVPIAAKCATVGER